jgi:hypothetical protein
MEWPYGTPLSYEMTAAAEADESMLMQSQSSAMGMSFAPQYIQVCHLAYMEMDLLTQTRTCPLIPCTHP